MLRDMWYEQRLETRSKPQPAHVLDLIKKKPAETAVDKALRELQDGPVRDLLRLGLHHGSRTSQLVPMLPIQSSMNSGPSFSSLRLRLGPCRGCPSPSYPRFTPPAVS